MNKKLIFASLLAIASTTMTNARDNFNYHVDNFADIQVLRYEVPGFDNLSLQEKEYIYYLTEAALTCRDH